MRNHKIISLALALILTGGIFSPSSWAAVKQGAASLLLPTTGQAMNGELGRGKTKLMAAVEVASITAITVIGLAGGNILWFGVAPLLANHAWSGTDAYVSARRQSRPIGADIYGSSEISEAQRTLDLSRQGRFEREQTYQSDLRERIRRAGEQAG